MKGLAKLEAEDVKIILKYISNATDTVTFINILRNIFTELSKEQKKSIEKLSENPKKYRVIINNIDTFTNILLEEMRGVNYE